MLERTLGIKSSIAVSAIEVVGRRIAQMLLERALGLESAVAVIAIEVVSRRLAQVLLECVCASVRPTTWAAICS